MLGVRGRELARVQIVGVTGRVAVGVYFQPLVRHIAAAFAREVEIGVVRQIDHRGLISVGAIIDFECVVPGDGIGDGRGERARKTAIAVGTDQRQTQSGLRTVVYRCLPDFLLKPSRATVDHDFLIRARAFERNGPAVQRKAAVAADAIGVTTDDGTEYAALFIGGQVVIAEHDVELAAAPVGHEQADDHTAEIGDVRRDAARPLEGIELDLLALGADAPVRLRDVLCRGRQRQQARTQADGDIRASVHEGPSAASLEQSLCRAHYTVRTPAAKVRRPAVLMRAAMARCGGASTTRPAER